MQPKIVGIYHEVKRSKRDLVTWFVLGAASMALFMWISELAGK